MARADTPLSLGEEQITVIGGPGRQDLLSSAQLLRRHGLRVLRGGLVRHLVVGGTLARLPTWCRGGSMIQLTAPLTPPENVQCPVPDGRADVRIDLGIAGAANLTAADDSDQSFQRLCHRILTVSIPQ